MHDTARDIGQRFFETYVELPLAKILEIGSYNVNGTLRDCAPPGAIYVGVDLSPGPGVDIVLEDPHLLPFADKHFDAVVSSSCFEHDPMFWVTFMQAVRVTKTGGFIYINAPSNGSYHTVPFDNWRFYPDAALSLVKWASHNGHQVELLESFIAKRQRDVWNDCVMVFCKGLKSKTGHRRIVDVLPGAYNIRRSATGDVENRQIHTEDMLLLDEARARFDAHEREVARQTSEARSLQARLYHIEECHEASLGFQASPATGTSPSRHIDVNGQSLTSEQAYEFTSDWFSWNIDTWRRIFADAGFSPRQVIEIGSYEGRSTVWMIENLLTGEGASVIAIDAWAEGAEIDQRGMEEVEQRFDRNMAIAKQRCPNVHIDKRKGTTPQVLSELMVKGLQGKVDFIYIDGGHHASDVLVDLVLGFQLCRVGGLIFCDDYLWEMSRAITETPKLAIDSFLTCYRHKVRIIPERFYQIYLQKTAE
jgi:predicted O-methyltransferase YrrM/SAM-dependent methyltransferase